MGNKRTDDQKLVSTINPKINKKKKPGLIAHINVLERISDGVIALDNDWCYTYLNQKAVELLNRKKPEDLVGKNIWEEFPEGVGKPFYKAYMKAIDTQQPIYLEEYFEPWDRYFENRIYPSIDGLTVYFTDITKRKKIEKKLNESLNKLKEAQEVAHLGSWYFDIHEQNLQWSDEMYHVFGVSKEEFDHSLEAFMRLIHPDDKDAMKTWIDQSATGIRPGELEFKVITSNKAVRWVRGDGKMICDKAGNPKALIGTALDITERKRAEEEIQKKQTFIESIINASPDVIYIYDVDKKMPVFTSLGLKRILGYDDEEIKSMGPDMVEKIMHPDDLALFVKSNLSVYPSLPDNKILEFDSRLKTKDGKWRNFHSKEMVFSRNTDGSTAQIFGILSDVTDFIEIERKKKELENRFQLALENIADVITIYDRDQRIQYVNEATQKITGLSGTDFVGKRDEEILPAEVVSVYKPTLEKVFRDHQTSSVEDVITFSDGREYFVRITCVPVLNDDGELIEVIGVTQDLTKIRKTENLFKESEERYRLLVENSPYAMGVIQEDKIVFVNPATVKILGAKDANEIIGIPISKIILPERMEYAQDRLKRLMEGEKGLYPVEERYRRLDGKEVIVDLTASPSTFNGKLAIQFIAVDVTEKKNAEFELANEEVRRRILIEQSRDGIVILDKEGRVYESNNKAAAMLGYSPEEFEKLRVWDWDSKFSKEEILKDLSDADEGGKLILTTHKRKDGSELDVEISTNATMFMGEKSIFTVIRDITERKKAQNQLQSTLEQLRQAIGTTIDVLIHAIEIRDPYTAGHQKRVADLARAIATEMELSSDRIQGLRFAASIHDIGKISVPSEILSKPTRLSELEYKIVREHAQAGYDILKNVDSPWPLAEIVHQHHEKVNGKGYPQGLKGDEILLESRILCVADVVEAMASHRPYRPSLGTNVALEEIKKNRGILYDEQVVDACLNLFKEGKFSFDK